jgi:hypothetical protein
MSCCAGKLAGGDVADEDGQERRSTPRQRTLKGGKIVFNAGRSVISCTVRSLSPAGARLTVASVVGIPDAFELQVMAEKPRPCRVVWRAAAELGVAFE